MNDDKGKSVRSGRAIRRIAARIPRYFLARSAASNVIIDTVSLAIYQQASGYVVESRYRLSVKGDEPDRPVMFDLSTTALQAVRIECEQADIEDEVLDPRNPLPVISLRPKQSVSWDGAVVKITLRWIPPVDQTSAGIPLVVVPELFPSLLQTCDLPRLQPVIRVRPVRSADVNVGGLIGPDGSDIGRASLLQAVLVGGGTELPPPSVGMPLSVILSPRLTMELENYEKTRATQLVRNIMEFLSELFGIVPSTRLVMSFRSEIITTALLPRGSILTCVPEEFGLRGRAGEPADINLAMRLAGLWWGAGCRLYGTWAVELETAIGAAAGLLWAEQVGEHANAATSVSNFRRQSKVSVLRNLFEGAQGKVRPRVVFPLIIMSYHLLRTDRATRHNLRELTVEQWGRICGSDAVAMLLLGMRPGDYSRLRMPSGMS